MAFIPVIDTARVELVYNVFGQVCENVLHVRNGSFWTDVTLEALGETIVGWWAAEMSGAVSDSVSLALVRCTNLGEADSYQVEVVGDPVPTGSLTSPALPLNCTLAIKFGTGLTGRSNRGRAYQIGLTEAQVTGNEMVGAATSAIIAAWEELQPALTGVSAFWRHVIVSYVTGGAPREEGLAVPVTTYSSDGFVDSQRRRLAGRGS